MLYWIFNFARWEEYWQSFPRTSNQKDKSKPKLKLHTSMTVQAVNSSSYLANVMPNENDLTTEKDEVHDAGRVLPMEGEKQ